MSGGSFALTPTKKHYLIIITIATTISIISITIITIMNIR